MERFDVAPGHATRAVLTGATGFLGAHLLRELLAREDILSICLVRARDHGDAEDRLWQRAQWYFPELDRAHWARRVRVLAADLTQPHFGLAEGVYRDIAESASLVINAAADVRHVGHRSELFQINTDAVQRLVEFSQDGPRKHLHHVSTVAVKGRFSGPAPLAAFTEQHLEEGQEFPDHPYAESKYRAELLLRDAARGGARVSIYRVGNIGPHGQTGRFQKNIRDNAFAAHVWACVRLGCAPYRPDTEVRLMAVDDMSRAITCLALAPGATTATYQIEHPRAIGHYDIIRVLHAFGYAIRLIGEADFMANAAHLADDDETLAVLLQTQAAADAGGVGVNSDVTLRQLSRHGFVCSPISTRWLELFLQHAIDVGFLEPPRFRRRVALPDLRL
jgi:thioester reductase-like protein